MALSPAGAGRVRGQLHGQDGSDRLDPSELTNDQRLLQFLFSIFHFLFSSSGKLTNA